MGILRGDRRTGVGPGGRRGRPRCSPRRCGSPTSTAPRHRGRRPGCRSSTGCWAAVSWRARSRWSAASRAWARARSCSRRSAISRRRGVRCLLVSGEESPAQVRMRADRLGALPAELFVVGETSLPAIVAHVETVEPAVLVIDSIQTIHDPDAPGAPGSVAQVRDGAQRLVRLAKEQRCRDVARRPRHQGRHARGPARARARRRHRVVVRRRSPSRVAHAPCVEAPLRRDRRARPHGDDRRRGWCRSPIRARCSSPIGAPARPVRWFPR